MGVMDQSIKFGHRKLVGGRVLVTYNPVTSFYNSGHAVFSTGPKIMELSLGDQSQISGI